jgi:O-antigen ligase
MLNANTESVINRLLWLGTPFVTLFLLTGPVTEPVNETKLVAAGGLGFALLGIFVGFGSRQVWQQSRGVLIASAVFVLACFNACANSNSPLVQNIFGSYGRNTGLVAYLSFVCIFLGALMMRQVESFERLLQGLFIAGVVNLIYCAWVLAFGDFIGWTNPYGNILGLFGNPDFISAFLGIFASSLLAVIVQRELKISYRIIGLFSVLLAIFEIKKSHAIQGLVVTAAGFAVVGFFLVRSFFKSKAYLYFYSAGVGILGILAVMGTLQKGPFSFVYKRSVSLRGTYWHTGITMGLKHPFTGVGMDSYGDWYRRARPPIALVDTPGIGTVSNASHNVILDFFAYGGWPLLLSYLAIAGFAIVAIIKVIGRRKTYDATFVALTAGWICYELQSIISINQIGLAIWGWVLAGALIAYEIATRDSQSVSPAVSHLRKSKKNSSQFISPRLLAGIGAIVGVLITAPPMSADAKFKSALDSKSANAVESSLIPSFYNFNDSYKYGIAVQTFAASNLPDLALKYARAAVKFNPDYFSAWYQLYNLQTSTNEEKATAISNMKRLDPLNPDVTKQ